MSADLESVPGELCDPATGGCARPPSIVDTFHYDPVAHAQNLEPALTPEEKQAVLHASKVTRDNHTQLFANFEMPDKERQSPYSCAAKGYTSMYSKSMLLADFIEGSGDDQKIRFSSRWEAIISVVRVPDSAIPPGMTEAHMLACVKALLERVAVSPAYQYKALKGYAKHVFGDQCGSAKDGCAWDARVSGHGQLLGVYKKRGVLAGEKDAYYLVAHSDSSVLGQALCSFAIKNPGMTLGEFFASPQMHRVRKFSRRQNRRLLARLIAALGLDRAQFKLKEDTLAHVNHSADEAYPEMVAGRLCKTVYNCFYDPQPSGDSLVYYNGTARIDSSPSSKYRHMAQLLGPHKGVMLVEVQPGKDYRLASAEVMKEGGAPIKTYHENHFCSWPVSVGKAKDAASAARVKASTLAKMNAAHLWLGKGDASETNERFASYKAPTEIDVARSRFILGVEHSPERELYLVPVVSIVAPPK